MMVCHDGNIFLDKIEKKFLANPDNGLFISLPVMLGLKSIQDEYVECLKELFNLKWTVGCAGGKHHMAYYFVGILNSKSKKSKLLYLDPHYVQEAIQSKYLNGDENEYDTKMQKAVKSYHCSKIQLIPIQNICSSVAIGFYLRDYDQFLKFKLKMLSMQKMQDSFLSIFEHKPEYLKKSYRS
mmetsp:Transcript_3781/g.2508  ORF Transcript_3781/g.2508 Transcript_3781/m.2508 type:complete len:182 (-) Transcript_3781:88-633(-)|eukprot:CAMPEP_0116875556 /NCGR_PEP_ID=MMETSP0463-20121206/7557_1 /TAXON_ID=181622 /ORGANISM="Strombidinopsis sp, Strain SopsisLIS2011" /LENGTH=181 /DNA_ID=CAMNT_0004521397 /DNA_START=687 /DNA_END=1232 /DNA_ORIENTATION=+